MEPPSHVQQDAPQASCSTPSSPSIPNRRPTLPLPQTSRASPHSPPPSYREADVTRPLAVYINACSRQHETTEGVYVDSNGLLFAEIPQKLLRELREDRHIYTGYLGQVPVTKYFFWCGFVFPPLWAVGALHGHLSFPHAKDELSEASSDPESRLDNSDAVPPTEYNQWGKRCLYAWGVFWFLVGTILIILASLHVDGIGRS